MARVHSVGDYIAVTAKTKLRIFTFEINSSVLNLKLVKLVDVDISFEQLSKSSTEDNKLPTDNGNAKGDSNNQTGCDTVSSSNRTADITANKTNKNPHREIDKQILSSSFSDDGRLIALVTSMKTCLVYERQTDWSKSQCIAAYHLPKAPSAVIFDAKREYVIVSDRAGYVCRYKLDSSGDIHSASTNTSANDPSNDEENECKGEMLLGHVSILLDIKLSQNGKYILSADRDEKLRVSRYPESYIIHQFCLGHTSYVNSICVASLCYALTSSGDGTIRVWNIETGETEAVYDEFDKKAISLMRKCDPGSEHPKDEITLAVVLKESAIVNVLAFNIEKLSFRKLCELSAVSNIVDVAFCKENCIVALSNDSVLFGEIRPGGGRLEVVQGTDEYLVNDLKEARDGLPCLEKKIGFDNMSEYRQRKLERIQNRKRKAEKVE